MENTLYNEIANKYVDAINEPSRQISKNYSQNPSLFNHIGLVYNKTILDVGCGFGYYSEKLLELNPRKIVGIDSSIEMIKIAKERNNQIDYRLLDATEMPIIDKFDLVLAIHVLHYVKTKRELLKLCKKIYNNTSSEGKFIAMIMNPDYDFKKQEYYPKKEYLSTFNKLEAPNEEENYKLIMTSKSSRIELDITYFSKNTYKQILQSAGFRKVNFHNLIVSKEGINKFGLDFWKEHLENPKSLLIECLP